MGIAFNQHIDINAIRYLNSTPNFVDIDNENLGVCPFKLEKYLKNSTKKIEDEIKLIGNRRRKL